MPTQREIALAGCDSALSTTIANLTQQYANCITQAKTDKQKRKECKDRYKKGMQLAKEVHNVNRELIDLVFPESEDGNGGGNGKEIKDDRRK